MKLRYLKKIGVELEGRWVDKPSDYQPDGSVGDFDTSYGVRGETTFCGSLSRVMELIDQRYPEEVNYTCGLHVHLSFKKLDYHRFLVDSPDLLSQFCDAINEWGECNDIHLNSPFWGRVGCRWSRNVWDSDRQVADYEDAKPSSRYTVVNFCPWYRHGTVEIRVGCMFRDFHLTQLFVLFVAEFFENFLRKNYRQERYCWSYTIPIPSDMEVLAVEEKPFVSSDDSFFMEVE